MADFTLAAPGTTNNPWAPSNVLLTSGTIRSDATGFRAGAAGTRAVFAHNVTYGSTITVTCTIASGATSNGDDLFMGAVSRTGTPGAGVGLVVNFSTIKLVSEDAAGNQTSIGASLSVTRANADVWTVTCTLSAGTWTITNVTQNGGAPFSFSGNTTTALGTDGSMAAGASFEPFNNNSFYLSQFTGTGVSGGGLNITPPVGTETVTGNAPNVTPATNTSITPFVARKGSGVLVPDHRLLVPERRIFLPTFKRAA